MAMEPVWIFGPQVFERRGFSFLASGLDILVRSGLAYAR